MPRFFIEQPLPMQSDTIAVGGDDQHHISQVLRLRTGDEIIVCDGHRTDYLCRIDAVDAAKVDLRVLKRMPNHAEPPYEVVLYQGTARSDRMDLIVQKSVELGVHKIVPFQCSRSVLRLRKSRAERKQKRWQKVSEAAAKQSGRGIVPQVSMPSSLNEVLSDLSGFDLPLFFWEGETQNSLRRYLKDRLSTRIYSPPRLAVIIGPEGGFSAAEAQAIAKTGSQPLSLGKRILRTETAGPAVLAMLTYQFDDF